MTVVNFVWTGAAQSFTVPAGVTLLSLTAGGGKSAGGLNGGYAYADTAVVAGQVINVDLIYNWSIIIGSVTTILWRADKTQTAFILRGRGGNDDYGTPGTGTYGVIANGAQAPSGISDGTVTGAAYATITYTASGGGTAFTGTATFTSTGTLTASGVATQQAAYAGTAALTGLGTLSTGATPAIAAAAGFSSSGTLATTPVAATTGTATLTSTGTLTAAPVVATSGSAALTSTGTLTATGVPASGATGAATLTGSGTLTAGGTPRPTPTVALTSTGTLTATGVPTGAGTGTATLTSTGTLTTTGTLTKASGVATLAGSGQLLSAGVPLVLATAWLSSTGTLTTYLGLPPVAPTIRHPRLTLTLHEPALALVLHQPRLELVMTDNWHVGDLEPPFAGTAKDGETPVSLATASTVTANIRRPDATILTREVTRGDQAADPGSWVMPWQTGDINVAGTWSGDVTAQWPGLRPQTFGQASWSVGRTIAQPGS